MEIFNTLNAYDKNHNIITLNDIIYYLLFIITIHFFQNQPVYITVRNINIII